MNDITNNIAIISNHTFEATKSQHVLHENIINALKKSLDFYELILTFSKQIQHLVPHDGFIYTNPDFKLNIQSGKRANNACSYRLIVEDMSLGQLKLMRPDKFVKTEIYLLETLLCHLINPLKNATLYNRALIMAYTTLLSHINNRPGFNESIKREITIARRYSSKLSLIFIDIDHFKTINEKYGHHWGDRVLLSASHCIKHNIRACDHLYRYSGKKFSLILSNTDISGALLLCERIRINIENLSLRYNKHIQIKFTASLGASELSKNDNANSFINKSDGAMYQAKINGRNQVVSR